MGFDILLGRQQITVPANTEPGTDYAIVRKSTIPILGVLHLMNQVFGDSGNCGETFTIVAA